MWLVLIQCSWCSCTKEKQEPRTEDDKVKMQENTWEEGERGRGAGWRFPQPSSTTDQRLGRDMEHSISRAFRGSTAKLVHSFHTSRLQNCETNNFCFCSQLGLGSSLCHPHVHLWDSFWSFMWGGKIFNFRSWMRRTRNTSEESWSTGSCVLVPCLPC